MDVLVYLFSGWRMLQTFSVEITQVQFILKLNNNKPFILVGGHSGVWSFTHTANPDYKYFAIPIDPVTGRREWSNNKVSQMAAV